MTQEQKEPKSVLDLADQDKSDLTFDLSVTGHKFDKPYTLHDFIEIYRNSGFQATNLSKAIDEINRMIASESKIFLGCTSNLITSGLHETICALIRNKKVNVFVTTAGGIEEDIIKTFKPTRVASFDLKGHLLRKNGFNRVGNLVIPNENYVLFEKWLTLVLDDLTKNYTNENPLILTPSKFIEILGSKLKQKVADFEEPIDYESSILYNSYKNQIKIYCPALTDGSIGDILTFYKGASKLKLDIVEDIKNMNYETIFQKSTGAIILGCGLVKHHILNANLFKNGADYCVLVNNASEFDGSDAGANIEEAVSWGKVKVGSKGVKMFGDATILFPLLVAGSFFSTN